MKKLISLFMAFIIVLSAFVFSSNAESDLTVISENVEYLEEGYYVVVTLIEENVSSSARATSTKTGTKNYGVYNSDNELLVTLSLKGTFTYNGSSATCTAATASYTIYNDQWKVPTATASRSGNVATGTFVAKHYVLFIVTQTINKTFSLTCSNTGTLS